MLVEAGCRAVIIAHSERRQFFGETDESANRKVKTALAAGQTPILCVGGTLAEGEAGNTQKMLEKQFRRALGAVVPAQSSTMLMAYQPGLAIRNRRSSPAMIHAV